MNRNNTSKRRRIDNSPGKNGSPVRNKSNRTDNRNNAETEYPVSPSRPIPFNDRIRDVDNDDVNDNPISNNPNEDTDVNVDDKKDQDNQDGQEDQEEQDSQDVQEDQEIPPNQDGQDDQENQESESVQEDTVDQELVEDQSGDQNIDMQDQIDNQSGEVENLQEESPQTSENDIQNETMNDIISITNTVMNIDDNVEIENTVITKGLNTKVLSTRYVLSPQSSMSVLDDLTNLLDILKRSFPSINENLQTLHSNLKLVIPLLGNLITTPPLIYSHPVLSVYAKYLKHKPFMLFVLFMCCIKQFKNTTPSKEFISEFMTNIVDTIQTNEPVFKIIGYEYTNIDDIINVLRIQNVDNPESLYTPYMFLMKIITTLENLIGGVSAQELDELVVNDSTVSLSPQMFADTIHENLHDIQESIKNIPIDYSTPLFTELNDTINDKIGFKYIQNASVTTGLYLFNSYLDDYYVIVKQRINDIELDLDSPPPQLTLISMTDILNKLTSSGQQILQQISTAATTHEQTMGQLPDIISTYDNHNSSNDIMSKNISNLKNMSSRLKKSSFMIYDNEKTREVCRNLRHIYKKLFLQKTKYIIPSLSISLRQNQGSNRSFFIPLIVMSSIYELLYGNVTDIKNIQKIVKSFVDTLQTNMKAIISRLNIILKDYSCEFSNISFFGVLLQNTFSILSHCIMLMKDIKQLADISDTLGGINSTISPMLKKITNLTNQFSDQLQHVIRYINNVNSQANQLFIQRNSTSEDPTKQLSTLGTSSDILGMFNIADVAIKVYNNIKHEISTEISLILLSKYSEHNELLSLADGILNNIQINAAVIAEKDAREIVLNDTTNSVMAIFMRGFDNILSSTEMIMIDNDLSTQLEQLKVNVPFKYHVLRTCIMNINFHNNETRLKLLAILNRYGVNPSKLYLNSIDITFDSTPQIHENIKKSLLTQETMNDDIIINQPNIPDESGWDPDTIADETAEGDVIPQIVEGSLLQAINSTPTPNEFIEGVEDTKEYFDKIFSKSLLVVLNEITNSHSYKIKNVVELYNIFLLSLQDDINFINISTGSSRDVFNASIHYFYPWYITSENDIQSLNEMQANGFDKFVTDVLFKQKIKILYFSSKMDQNRTYECIDNLVTPSTVLTQSYQDSRRYLVTKMGGLTHSDVSKRLIVPFFGIDNVISGLEKFVAVSKINPTTLAISMEDSSNGTNFYIQSGDNTVVDDTRVYADTDLNSTSVENNYILPRSSHLHSRSASPEASPLPSPRKGMKLGLFDNDFVKPNTTKFTFDNVMSKNSNVAYNYTYSKKKDKGLIDSGDSPISYNNRLFDANIEDSKPEEQRPLTFLSVPTNSLQTLRGESFYSIYTNIVDYYTSTLQQLQTNLNASSLNMKEGILISSTKLVSPLTQKPNNQSEQTKLLLLTYVSAFINTCKRNSTMFLSTTTDTKSEDTNSLTSIEKNSLSITYKAPPTYLQQLAVSVQFCEHLRDILNNIITNTGLYINTDIPQLQQLRDVLDDTCKQARSQVDHKSLSTLLTNSSKQSTLTDTTPLSDFSTIQVENTLKKLNNDTIREVLLDTNHIITRNISSWLTRIVDLGTSTISTMNTILFNCILKNQGLLTKSFSNITDPDDYRQQLDSLYTRNPMVSDNDINVPINILRDLSDYSTSNSYGDDLFKTESFADTLFQDTQQYVTGRKFDINELREIVRPYRQQLMVATMSNLLTGQEKTIALKKSVISIIDECITYVMKTSPDLTKMSRRYTDLLLSLRVKVREDAAYSMKQVADTIQVFFLSNKNIVQTNTSEAQVFLLIKELVQNGIDYDASIDVAIQKIYNHLITNYPRYNHIIDSVYRKHTNGITRFRSVQDFQTYVLDELDQHPDIEGDATEQRTSQRRPNSGDDLCFVNLSVFTDSIETNNVFITRREVEDLERRYNIKSDYITVNVTPVQRITPYPRSGYGIEGPTVFHEHEKFLESNHSNPIPVVNNEAQMGGREYAQTNIHDHDGYRLPSEARDGPREKYDLRKILEKS